MTIRRPQRSTKGTEAQVNMKYETALQAVSSRAVSLDNVTESGDDDALAAIQLCPRDSSQHSQTHVLQVLLSVLGSADVRAVRKISLTNQHRG